MRIAVISDTHFPGRGQTLPDAAVNAIAGSAVLIHAGDLSDLPTLRMLQRLTPRLVVVHGNADDDEVRRLVPATATVELPGLRLGVTHNGGAEVGRLERLRRRFAGCGGVVFGHSHIPLHAAASDGFFILNPGSATDRRRQPHHSMALIDVTAHGRPIVSFLNLDTGHPLEATAVRTAG